MGIVARIDPEGRLQIPEEWGEEFAPDREVELVRCDEGLLVKPLRKTRLQLALARKVAMNRPTHLDLSDLDMDALGWS